MLRVIFDTNIYGHLIKERDAAEIQEKIVLDKGFVVYAYKPIRKEIRDIPKVTKSSKQTRLILLELYDKLTEGHFLENSIKITSLAKKYYNVYQRLGGIYNWNTSIKIDFMIVACASFYGLDIVYSADNKTLRSKKAIKSYKQVNIKQNFRSPCLLDFEDLLRKYRSLL